MSFTIAALNSTTNRSISRLITAAQRAGEAIGTNEQDEVYAQLILMDGLDDSQRERLGFATHMIARAKQAGTSPAELWRFIQNGFSKNQRQLTELNDADDIELSVLAYGIGACQADSSVCSDILGYLNNFVSNRIAEDNLAFAWAQG